MERDLEQKPFINILVAEDNDVSREMMAGILRTQGYQVYGATDGEAAIKVIQDREIDIALVDINMAPRSGLDFIKYLVVSSINIPVVIITGDDSSHILMEATSLGVTRVIQKPVEPDKLLQVVHRLLKQRGVNPQPLAVTGIDMHHTPESLMHRAVELADKNAKSKRGGPFGAVVSDERGKIIGEGVNGVTSRADPIAHAEVMAIRQAAEKLGKTDLSGCVLYCSSQPTMIGQALIGSVGIKKVYYGLSHEDVTSVREDRTKHGATKITYSQIGRADALTMFKSWESLPEKVAD